MSAIDVDIEVVGPSLEEGDHDRFTHIVKDKAKLTEAIVTGTPVTALCGKVWVPRRS